jgi:ankyrin repeat protein
VNASNKYGQTALDIAKNRKSDDCVKFLEELQQKGQLKVEVLSKEEKNTTVKKRGMWQRIFGGRD